MFLKKQLTLTPQLHSHSQTLVLLLTLKFILTYCIRRVIRMIYCKADPFYSITWWIGQPGLRRQRHCKSISFHAERVIFQEIKSTSLELKRSLPMIAWGKTELYRLVDSNQLIDESTRDPISQWRLLKWSTSLLSIVCHAVPLHGWGPVVMVPMPVSRTAEFCTWLARWPSLFW